MEQQQQQNARAKHNSQQHLVTDEGTTSLSEPSSWPPQEGSRRGEGESDDSLYNSSEQGTESTTKDPAPSTSEEDGVSSLDSGSEADDEEGGSSAEESITSMIDFLREKQRLLKRASDHFAREEAYNAFNAVNDAKLPATLASVETGIWNDAKKFLIEETASGSPPSSASSDCSGDSDDADNNKKRSFVAATAPVAPSLLKSNPCPRAKEIDTSQVNLMSSKTFEQEYRQEEHSLRKHSKVDMLIGQEKWMAHALTVSTTPSTSSVTTFSEINSNKNYWQLVSDPQTCSTGLLPPRHMSLRHSVTLQDAMAITDEAQLVTQSMPPFTVVSANKAFFLLAGLKSTKKIVGEPIESVLQLSQQRQSEMSSTDRLALTEPSMARVLFWSKGDCEAASTTSNKIKACNLQVKPVVHEAPRKRRRLNDNESSSYLSHLLVVLQETPRQAPVVLGTVG